MGVIKAATIFGFCLYLGPRRHFCRKWLMRLYVCRVADPLRLWSLSVYHWNKPKNQLSLVSDTFKPIFPLSEAFIKSTPLRSILELLPCTNIYHCLKVHLLVHQSFGDLCRLLEMDVIWRKHSHFTTWPNIKANIFHQSKYSLLVQGFYRVTMKEHWRILSCSLTEKNNRVWMRQRNVPSAVPWTKR